MATLMSVLGLAPAAAQEVPAGTGECRSGASVATPDFDAGWFHNAPALTRRQDLVWANPPAGPIVAWDSPRDGSPIGADTSVVANYAADEVVGAGLTPFTSGVRESRYLYRGVGGAGSTFSEAVAANDYLQYQFTTPASVNPRLFFKRLGYGAWNSEQYQYAVRVSTTPAFTSFWTIAQDVTVIGGGGFTYNFRPTDTTRFPFLQPNTTYYLRVYLYNRTVDITPGSNSIAADDFQFGTALCPLPTMTVTKVSNGGVGSFAFTGSNGFANQTIATTAPGMGVAGATQTLTSASAATTVTEVAPPAGFALQSIVCTGLGAGGTFTPTINGVNGGAVALDAAATVSGSDIRCTFTNIARTTVQLAKAWDANSVAGHTVTIGATTGGSNNTVAFNAIAPNAANSGAAVTVDVGDIVTLPAETGADAASYTTTVACTGGHGLSGSNGQQSNTLTLTSTNAAVCTYTNTLNQADLSVTKTNNASTLTRGSQTNYTVTVRNNGPSAANGALVRDTPVSNLGNCSVIGCAPVGATPAAACPATPGDLLIPAGTTLGPFVANSAVQFTVQCTVGN